MSRALFILTSCVIACGPAAHDEGRESGDTAGDSGLAMVQEQKSRVAGDDSADGGVGPSTRGFAMAAPSCTLYLDRDYGGANMTFFAGHDYNDLHSVGLGDMVSSVRCVGGGSVTLYEGRHFTGRSSGVITRARRLQWPIHLDDQASSVTFGW